MRFQPRDGMILLTIYLYGGVLTLRHIKLLFWPEATTLRAVQKRLAKLVNNGYLDRPTTQQWKTRPIPEPIFWLGWKGIIWVAGQLGARVDSPANTGENQLRELARQLRTQGIRWLRQPRFILLSHDIAVIDCRLQVEKAVSEFSSLSLEVWIHEGEFRSAGDAVEYEIRGQDGKVKQVKKRVIPDSYFVIEDKQRLDQGLPAKARLLLEVDGSTHPLSRFAREKVLPGLAYIKSPEYKARFGANAGRWVVVVLAGKRRVRNLMRQTQEVSGAGARTFLFTTFDQFSGAGNVLTDSIWWQVGQKEPLALFAGY